MKIDLSDLHLKSFYNDVSNCSLIYSRSLTYRFLLSILTKNFTILTGLSGSGKTQISLSFAKWITTKSLSSSTHKLLSKGTIIKANRVEYRIADSDSCSAIFEQIDSETRVTLSYEIIKEWIKTIEENNYDESVSVRKIREKVKENSKYSSQEHSFETHLKAVAFYLINKPVNNDIKKQFLLIPVGADWINREPLLGYPNALKKDNYVLPDSGVLQLLLNAKNDPTRPYFLILDEMNLSHVERYFADFLSALESGEEIKLHSGSNIWANGYKIPSTLSIPKNLFIIGTVNIDETTYMFSPKVLDRANVIEFRVSKDELAQFFENSDNIDLSLLEGKGASMGENFVDIATSNAEKYSNKKELTDVLLKFFAELTDVGAEFGYRTAFEVTRFAGLAEKLSEDWKFNNIIDAAIAQKLLPKLHGSRRKLEKVLFRLGQLCLTEGDAEVLLKKPGSIIWDHVKYPISFEKIVRMHKGLVENGFTSFAEA